MAVPSQPLGSADAVQIELLRRAGGARRLALARSLSSTMIELARSAIRARDPDLPEQEVLLRFAALHYGPELAERVRRHLERRR